MKHVPWKRLFGFAVSPALSALAPLLILPVISRELGVAAWSAIAIGQSVGLASAVIVAWGWNIIGPTAVASMNPTARNVYYVHSFRVRFVILAGVSVIGSLIVFLTVHHDFLFAALAMAFALALSGLSATWYFVGSGEPLKLLTYEAIPKFIAALVAIPLVIIFHRAEIYPVVLGVFVGLGVFAADRHVRKSRTRVAHNGRDLVQAFMRNGPIASSQLLATTYTSLSVTLVSVGAMGNVVLIASFAAGFRLLNLFQAGLAAIMTGFQGWVAESWNTDVRRHVNTAIAATLSVSFMVAVALGCFLGPTATWLFGDDIVFDSRSSILLAVAFFSYSLTACSALFLLVPSGNTNIIAVATGCASVVAIIAIVWFSSMWGLAGGCAAILLSELVVLAVEAPVIIRVFRTVQASSHGFSRSAGF